MVGKRLGSYEIREQIGQGGMSIVYRAYHFGTERDVAIKVITKTMSRDNDTVQRFQREARLIARLEHPHILPVYDFDSGHTPPYIVMRFLNGGTLQELQQQSRFSLEDAGVLISHVCEALHYAHRQGIIHRDIKPSNILFDREGHAFVADFGVARMITPNQPSGTITSTGTMVGTPNYIAPEQAYGRTDVDHRADIYSLGVILFELLTGQLPFISDSVMGVVLKHLHERIPSAVDINPGLPLDIDQVIFRSLAKEPGARYASALDLANAVLNALGMTSTSHLQQVTQKLLINSTHTSPSISKPGTQAQLLAEQYKSLTVIYINATEYMEIVDAWQGGQEDQQTHFWQTVEQILTEYGGHIITRIQDTLLAVWGVDALREDDAVRAIQAALAIQQDLQQRIEVVPDADHHVLPLNIAVHTGLALLNSPDTVHYTVRGTAISVTNRLMQQASGMILITHDIYNQIRGMFDIETATPLKIYHRGSTSLLPTYRVLASKAHIFAMQIRGVEGITTPTIGRQLEMDRLQKIFLDVIEDKEARFITLMGTAGLGKSRLFNEFASWVDVHPQRVRLLPGRATLGMRNQPYALVRDLISFRFDIQDNDSPALVRQKLEMGIQQQIGSNDRMAHFLGYLVGFDMIDSPYVQGLTSDPQQLSTQAKALFFDWLTKLCTIDPVIIELEDIHYADDASLDLLTSLMSQNGRYPLLMVCMARPELLLRRPTWGSGQSAHTSLELQPLSKRESRQLIQMLLQKADEVPQLLYNLLIEQAEGNPYYLEELIRMLLDERIIIKDTDRVWRIEITRLDHLQVPTTLTWLMQTRLDSLLHPEKIVLQRAAVIGRTFYDVALKTLDDYDETHVDDLPNILKQLSLRGFIHERETTAFSNSTEYIFASNLIRDVLLQTLLPQQKQAYNLAAANWLIQTGADRVDEHSNLIATYFERAGHLPEAAHYLHRAGERALLVSAFEEACVLFEETLALLSESAESFPVTQLKLGEAYYWLSDYAAATKRFSQALASSEKQANNLHRASALYWLSQVAVREGAYPQAQAYLEESRSLARTENNAAILANVLFGLGDLQWRQGNFEQAQMNCTESMHLARQLNNTPLILRALNRLGAIAMSHTHLDSAQRIYEETYALAQQSGNRSYAASALNNLGELTLLQGELIAAQHYYQQALLITHETHQHNFTALLYINLATVAIRLDNIRDARQCLYDGLLLSAKLGASPTTLAAVQRIGWLRLKQGNQARGLALLGLTWHHPATDSENQREVQEIFDDLGLRADKPDLLAGLAAGRDLDLDTVVAEELAELTHEETNVSLNYC